MADHKRSTGRPPLYDVPASTRVSVKMTPAQRLDLRRVASDNGTGVSGIIREAVNEFVSDYGDRRPFGRTKRRK
jgi:hypothetical protein